VIVETGEKPFNTAALIDKLHRSKVDEAIKLEVVLKIERNVRIRSPIRALSEIVVKKFRDLPLADERFLRPATISLILGADVYPKVIQPGFHVVA